MWVAVVTSHMFIVWSHDALHTSFSPIQSTDETASLWPSRVMRGVCSERNQKFRIKCWQLMSNTSGSVHFIYSFNVEIGDNVPGFLQSRELCLAKTVLSTGTMFKRPLKFLECLLIKIDHLGIQVVIAGFA